MLPEIRWVALGLGLIGLGAALGLVGSGLVLRALREEPRPAVVPAGPPRVEMEPAPKAVAEFRRRLMQTGHIVFRSHEGKAYRSDDDWELTFGPPPEQRIDLLLFGLGLEHQRGHYDLDDDARIAMTWPNPPSTALSTLQLALERQTGALLLRPAPGHVGEPDDDTWKFRVLNGKDEQRALDDLACASPQAR